MNNTFRVSVILVLLLGAIAAIARANFAFVQENPGGNDFLVHWVGTRSLLVDGLSPYSDEVALRIQKMAYGRPALPGEHELRVAYPLYSATIFLPFALIGDYNLARAAWMTLLEASLVGLALLTLSLTGWKPGLWVLPLFFLFTLTWYFSARALINGNAVVLVALVIAASFAAIRARKDEAAGILLAFSTIKPQVALLLVIFVWIWAISVRRWAVVGWTVISVIGLSIGAAFFVPDWPLQNLWEILRYPGYNPAGTPGAALAIWWPAAGFKMGVGLTVLLAAVLLVEWLAARGKDFRWFLWTASLTLVAGQWIGIQTDPGNFVVLFIPLILVLAMWEEHWGNKGRLVSVVSMVALFIGFWALFLATVETTNGQPQQNPVMFFPLPILLFIGLYWVRWWAIHPNRLLTESLRSTPT